MMKTKIFLFFMLTGVFSGGKAHSQIAEVPARDYVVISVNSQLASDSVQKAFDSDTTTWWAVNTAQNEPLPAILTLDLGRSHHVCGLRYRCNPQNTEDKLARYEVYVSNDTSHWGTVQAKAGVFWNDAADVSGKDLLFGAVQGRYVRIVYLDNTNTWNHAIQTSELRVLANDTVTQFRKNQYLYTDSLPVLVSAHDTTLLKVKSASGEPVVFRVLSGPGSVMEKNGDYALVCEGAEGVVVLEVRQDGTEEYYPVSSKFAVEVQNPDYYGVNLYTSLVESETIVMPSDTLCYPLQARAEIGSAFNRITEMSVLVAGKPVPARWDEATGVIRADFRPGRYGEFEVSFRALASNGRDTTVTRRLQVDSARETRTVRSFDHLLINFPDPGRTNGGVYVFPQHVGSYQRIIAKMDVQCPQIEGGCDDWDRVAWVEIQTPDGQWREIIRYTTAYGVPCKHELDVSDFASWLQGEVPMRMFVDTWGTGGYDVTLDFEFVKGLPQYLYAGIVPLWNGNFPFGDIADLQPLDTLRFQTPLEAAALNLKVVTTGHGWGGNNTSNAAEFYRAKHTIYVNGETFSHEPWMDCNPNPDNCTGQRGTWAYDRAGWCPGAIAPGYNYNLTAHRDQEELDLRFIFQENYIDHCHPHHPECISGVTCTDCMDTYNPQYYIASYLIAYYNKMYDSLPDVANQQVDERKELNFTTYPNPAVDRFFVQTYGQTGSGNLQIIDMRGDVIRNFVFKDGKELNGTEFRVGDFPAGFYLVRIQTLHGNGIRKIIVK